MRLVLFEGPGAGRGIRPGVLTDDGVVDLTRVTDGFDARTPQQLMTQIIDDFEELRAVVRRGGRIYAAGAAGHRAAAAAAAASRARSSAASATTGSTSSATPRAAEHVPEEPGRRHRPRRHHRPAGATATARCTDGPGPYMFQHEAELALVIKGPAKSVPRDDWRSAVFGFTGMIDVSAACRGRSTWRQGSWMGKSFDTFAPDRPLHHHRWTRSRTRTSSTCSSGTTATCATTTTPTTWSTACRSSSSSRPRS